VPIGAVRRKYLQEHLTIPGGVLNRWPHTAPGDRESSRCFRRLGEVVRALEARQALVECFRGDGGACVLTARCGLKMRLAAAREAFMPELDTTTLSECAYPARPRKNRREPRIMA
jgi:hypothetical protein